MDEYCIFNNGKFGRVVRSLLFIILDTPSFLKKFFFELFLVNACTLNPSFTSIIIEISPTPPEAPLIKIGLLE